MPARHPLLASLTLALALTGCAALAPAFTQDSLPDAVKVPAGHKVAIETVGVGQITYECRTKAGGGFEWAFVGPDAVLNGRNGQAMGRYHGPPATWEASDGSKFSGAQVAVSPAPAGNIPLQLVKANPAWSKDGKGLFEGVTFVQRVATKGGVAPAMACDAAATGKKEVVRYQADYILWKAA